jgi:hypothetical protein
VIVTCDTVGGAIGQLARYFRLVDAPHVLHFQGEDPIRVVFESRDGRNSTFGFEFGLALNLLHIREEAGDCFRASYASFRHMPDDAAEIEQVLGCPVETGAMWNGFALSRSAWNLPLRRPNRRDGCDSDARVLQRPLPHRTLEHRNTGGAGNPGVRVALKIGSTEAGLGEQGVHVITEPIHRFDKHPDHSRRVGWP